MAPRADRHDALAPLCAAAAMGRSDALPALARAALDAGCTGEEVREALLTLAPFCGYPRALDALAEVRPLLPQGEPAWESMSSEWPSRGSAFFQKVYGANTVRVLTKLRAIDPEVAGWILVDAYGKVLARTTMPASLRERIGVVLLVAQRLRNQLSGHVRGALNCGATAAEIGAFLDAAAAHLSADEVAFARETLARVVRGRGESP